MDPSRAVRRIGRALTARPPYNSPMRLLTWNTDLKHIKREKVERRLDVIRRWDPDIVALQEVPCGWDEDYEDLLKAAGYSFVEFARKRGDANKYGNLTAVRSSARQVLEPRERGMQYPELFLDVDVGTLRVINAHVPNGEGFGFEKVEFWVALREYVLQLEQPFVVVGDFNAPGMETPDRVVCAGIELKKDGRWCYSASVVEALGLAAAAKLLEDSTTWCYWNESPAFPGGGERWEAEEGWLFNHGAEHGIRDLYRALHPVAAGEPAYSMVNPKRRYDHAFGSRHVKAESAQYDMQALLEGRSDHAPLIVDVDLDA